MRQFLPVAHGHDEVQLIMTSIRKPHLVLTPDFNVPPSEADCRLFHM